MLSRSSFTYIALALVLVLMMGLLGWYIVLKRQAQSINNTATARGFNTGVPSFQGAQGSTLGNIAAGLGGTAPNAAPAGKEAPRLWHVQATPSAGLGFLNGATTSLRIMERSTGYLYDATPQTSAVVRVTNTLVPKVYAARFTNNRDVTAWITDRGVPAAFVGKVNTATSSDGLSSLSISALGKGILDIVPAPYLPEILTLVDDAKGGSVLIRSHLDTTKPQSIFTSPLSGWNVHWLSDGRITLSQKAATGVTGSAYQINKGVLSPIAENLPGLTILPKASSTAVLIGTDAGVLDVSVRISDNASTIVLPVKTLPEKCVWAPSSATSTKSVAPLVVYCAVPSAVSSEHFVDDWYRGVLHTSDSWWRIDASAGTATLLVSPESEFDVRLDVENPIIDDTGEYIGFDNAIDQSPWLLKINK